MEKAGFLDKHRKTILLVLGNLIALLIIYKANAQNAEGYIYGKVHTFRQTYQGQIRWGKEEAFWNDYFNASKTRDSYYNSFVEKDDDDDTNRGDLWDDIDWSISSIWDNKGHVSHEFSTQFGNLASIRNKGRSRVDVELKNGMQLELSGRGYNDVGSTIIVYDEELGRVKLDWDRIDKVEFMPTPKNLRVQGGRPLYGTVETFRKGSYSGYVQWDHDERLGDDVLDGESRDGDMEIPFGNIRIIERERGGSYVTLKSGREFLLRGTNDVNESNDGIIVSVDGIGKIDIPWKVFEKVTFKDVESSGPSYESYAVPKGLSGTVITYDRDEFKGRILYDIDEAWEVETLEADDDEIEYKVAFANIEAIAPKNSEYCRVILKNGEELFLGERRDVSDDNDGILVFESSGKDPVYIRWRDVAEVRFN